MKAVQIILGGMGAFFIILGGGISIVFLSVDLPLSSVVIPGIFVTIGIAFVIGITIPSIKKRSVLKKGTRYAGKVYGYVDNTTYTVNGTYTVNTKVRYFDQNSIEREAIIPTGFIKGSTDIYPIGMTIDIYEYKGKFNYDPTSVRPERLSREAELMDDKPLNPGEANVVAIQCKNCGATFEAVVGYSNKCPYCDSYLNA